MSKNPPAKKNPAKKTPARKANDALAVAEEAHAASLRDLMEPHVPHAVKTLSQFAQGKSVGKVKPNANVVRSSARDIIEFAEGRPETRQGAIVDNRGVQIFIQQFGSDEARALAAQGITPTQSRGPQYQSTPNGTLEQAEIASSKIAREYEVVDDAVEVGEGEE